MNRLQRARKKIGKREKENLNIKNIIIKNVGIQNKKKKLTERLNNQILF